MPAPSSSSRTEAICGDRSAHCCVFSGSESLSHLVYCPATSLVLRRGQVSFKPVIQRQPGMVLKTSLCGVEIVLADGALGPFISTLFNPF